MVRKKIIIISTLLACLVFLPQCSILRAYFGNEGFALFYNNFLDNDIIMPSELLNINNTPLDINAVFAYDSPMINEEKGKIVSDSITRIISSLEMEIFWSDNEKHYTKLFDADYKQLFCMGRIFLSNEFDSYLFLTKASPERGESKDLFLINIKGRKLLSIVSVGGFFLVEINSARMWTIPKSKNKFLQKTKTLSSDVFYPWFYPKHKVNNGFLFEIGTDGRIIPCI